MVVVLSCLAFKRSSLNNFDDTMKSFRLFLVVKLRKVNSVYTQQEKNGWCGDYCLHNHNKISSLYLFYLLIKVWWSTFSISTHWWMFGLIFKQHTFIKLPFPIISVLRRYITFIYRYAALCNRKFQSKIEKSVKNWHEVQIYIERWLW